MSETLTNGRKSGSSNKVGWYGGGESEGAPLLLMVSMIVANSKEKKWETGGEGFGITTEKDFAPYIALQNNASKISEPQQHPCPSAGCRTGNGGKLSNSRVHILV